MTKIKLLGYGLLLLVFSVVLVQASPPDDYRSNLSLIDGSLKEYPYNYDGRFKLGSTLQRSGKVEASKRVFSNLLADYPDDPDVLLKLGFAELRLKNLQAAVNRFRAVIEEVPDYPDAYYGLGLARRKQNNLNAALEAFDRAIEEDPERAEFYIARGNAYRAKGRYEAAEDDYRRAGKFGAKPSEIPEIGRPEPGVNSGQMRAYTGRIVHGIVDVKDNNSTWRIYRSEVGYRGESWNVILNFHRENRGDTWDSLLGVNTYFDLWGSAYGNVNYQFSPQHQFLAEDDVFVEYFQPFGEGWVGSVNFRNRNFDALDINSFGARIARYQGFWFYRLSAQHLDFRDSPDDGTQGSFLIRNYLWQNNDDYVQVSTSFGENVEPLETGPTGRLLNSHSVAFFLRKYVTDSIGVELLLQHTDPERISIRQRGHLGLIARW